MTKEDAIKEAWIQEIGLEAYEEVKDRIDENGWDTKLKFYEIDSEKFDYRVKGHGVYITRPKELIGIEHNNGWIKIESESDLPKTEEKIPVWVIDKKGVIKCDVYQNNWENQTKWFVETFTHYKPIETTKPPIY